MNEGRVIKAFCEIYSSLPTHPLPQLQSPFLALLKGSKFLSESVVHHLTGIGRSTVGYWAGGEEITPPMPARVLSTARLFPSNSFAVLPTPTPCLSQLPLGQSPMSPSVQSVRLPNIPTDSCILCLRYRTPRAPRSLAPLPYLLLKGILPKHPLCCKFNLCPLHFQTLHPLTLIASFPPNQKTQNTCKINRKHANTWSSASGIHTWASPLWL